MPTAADVPTSSPAVSSRSRSLTRRSPCTSPMIPDAGAFHDVEKLIRHTLRGPLRIAAAGDARTHTGARENERERERERERRRGERRERGRRTRAAATAASAAATAWWCGDQGGCTGCLDDHRVMSLEAWRPAAAADDDPEAAFPAGGWWPVVVAPLTASPLRPNSRREFASSS